MKKLLMLLVCLITVSTSAQAATPDNNNKTCIFDDLEIYDVNNNPQKFKLFPDFDEQIDAPKIFKTYEKRLGDMSIEECKGAIKKQLVLNKADQQLYMLFYTNEDVCDGGNAYGLVVGDKKNSPKGDGVVAFINDSFIECAK
jgi:hypothetical protein